MRNRQNVSSFGAISPSSAKALLHEPINKTPVCPKENLKRDLALQRSTDGFCPKGFFKLLCHQCNSQTERTRVKPSRHKVAAFPRAGETPQQLVVIITPPSPPVNQLSLRRCQQRLSGSSTGLIFRGSSSFPEPHHQKREKVGC